MVWVFRGVTAASVFLVTALLLVYILLQKSLPVLDGEVWTPHLENKVNIYRDENGVAVISGESRTDVAYATGYLHAQERFFQMDLNRRNAAGEIAELVGNIALEHDKYVRLHNFHSVARKVLESLPANHQSIIKAYADGVNQGLRALRSKPFEYWLLGTEPSPWQPEDTFLAVFSMYLDLNDHRAGADDLEGFLHRQVPDEIIEFINPLYTQWDAPLQESVSEKLKIPGEDVINLRKEKPESFLNLQGELKKDVLFGSNSAAVSGTLTDHGSSIVENDMHLNIRVPNTWYRAQFRYPDPDSGGDVTITGVTLPGAPLMVAGSNGKIAWAFTNSYGDWVDLISLDINSLTYNSSKGRKPLKIRSETIQVKGEAPVFVEYQETEWGPVVPSVYDGSIYALRWTAHNPEATNANLINLETAISSEQAVAIANRSGMPPQNFVTGDSNGNIAWSIAGKIPRRSDIDTSFPIPWQVADKHWSGWLHPSEYPSLINPGTARLWTANARIAAGEDLKKIGDGGYAFGPRQKQIMDGLLGINHFQEKDLLNIVLDDNAVYMSQWRQLILTTLSEEVRSENEGRALFYNHVKGWSGKAAIDDIGYRLVREYHDEVRLKILQWLGRYFKIRAGDNRLQVDDVYLQTFSHHLEMVWRLVSERPENWLNPQYASWDEFLLKSVDEVIRKRGGSHQLSKGNWGERNTAKINHPLSSALPLIGGFLNMPDYPLSGDSWMPKIQNSSFGASERMVVAPGKEEDGIFHMPGGQSGHPLSPFYKKGYKDWVEGNQSPFLPGEAVYQLTLSPLTPKEVNK